jgi:hypothetical protein
MLVSAKQQAGSADGATADKLTKEYQAWTLPPQPHMYPNKAVPSRAAAAAAAYLSTSVHHITLFTIPYAAASPALFALPQSHKLPWQMLVSAKQQAGSADDATADKLTKEYQAWLQSAAVADAKAEIEGLQVRIYLGVCVLFWGDCFGGDFGVLMIFIGTIG